MTDDRFHDPALAINRVYTGHGDAGSTRLVGGQRVLKTDLRIECYGTVDELNAMTGAARISCIALGLDDLAADLLRVQHALFNLGNTLATLAQDMVVSMPRVRRKDIAWLEERMDAANADLPGLRSFVLPGGNRANVELHLCRTICRRAERLCVALDRRDPEEPMNDVVLPYINRLSDAFFVWSRVAALAAGGEELTWDPNAA